MRIVKRAFLQALKPFRPIQSLQPRRFRQCWQIDQKLHSGFIPDLRELDQDLNRLDHFVDTNPFQYGVQIVLARGEVRRRQANLGQSRSVGPATNDLLSPFPPQSLVRFFGEQDGSWLLRQAVAQVAILPYDIDVDLNAGDRFDRAGGRRAKNLFVVTQFFGIKISQQDFQLDIIDLTAQIVRMQKPVAVASSFGR